MLVHMSGNLILWSWSLISLDFRGPPHPQTSILNKLWNSINSFIIQANFDYQWTFVPMNWFHSNRKWSGQFLQDTLPARLVYGHDIEWFGCTRKVMYDNNHGNVQQVFPVSTPNDCTDKPKTLHKNSICPIKPQCVEYNFIMAVLNTLWTALVVMSPYNFSALLAF